MKTTTMYNDINHSNITNITNITNRKNGTKSNEVSVSETILKINSLMLSFIIMANLLSLGFAAFGILEEGLLPIIFAGAIIISYTVTLLNNPNNIRINLKALALLLFVLVFFFFTFIVKGFNTVGYDYFIEFLAYGFIVYLMTLVPFKSSYVIRYSMLSGIIFMFNPDAFISLAGKEYSAYNTIEMGSSYAILTSVLAAIIHFSFYRNLKNIFNIAAYIVNAYLLWLLITEATRGAVLAILVLFCFILYIKFMQKQILKKEILLPTVFFFITTLIVVIVLNLEKLLYWLYITLQNLGIEVAIIQKTYIKMNDEGFVGVFNGRDVVYQNAISLFYNSPIFGNGVGAYEDMYGIWPHNLFLQLLVDGGLLLCLPLTAIIFVSIKQILKPWSGNNNSNGTKLLLLFLFTACMPRLMLSSYLWMQQTFWLMIFICLSVLMSNSVKNLIKD